MNLEVIFSLIGTVALFLVLIIIHEAGHFFAARHFGMQTPVVGLGLPFFGGYSVLFRMKDVEFRLHPLLLGAYVAIPELDEESGMEDSLGVELNKPMQFFPTWQRLIVSAAGPVANLLGAFVIALGLVTFIGVPEATDKAVFVTGYTELASPQVKESLMNGDRILQIDRTAIAGAMEFKSALEKSPEKSIELALQRDYKTNGESFAMCQIVQIPTDSAGRLNIKLEERPLDVRYIPVKGIPIIAHIREAWITFAGWLQFCANILGYLISSPFTQAQGGAKLSDVHGIVLATNIIAESMRQSTESVMNFAGFISIELAIFNLLPILPLDGGHILFQLAEVVTGGKKLNAFRELVGRTGLILIMALAAVALYNDLHFLFTPHQP